jgi:hypothetical protein
MQLIATSKKHDLEVYANFDQTAQIWELFAEREAICYVGCADNIQEARQIARDWILERAAY